MLGYDVCERRLSEPRRSTYERHLLSKTALEIQRTLKINKQQNIFWNHLEMLIT